MFLVRQNENPTKLDILVRLLYFTFVYIIYKYHNSGYIKIFYEYTNYRQKCTHIIAIKNWLNNIFAKKKPK